MATGGEHPSAAALDASFSSWAASLAADQVAALRRYQSTNRTYRLVNGVLRIGVTALDGLAPSERQVVVETVAAVSSAVASGVLAEPVEVWRGVRNLVAVFGAGPAQAEAPVGRRRTLAGFASTTLDRSVAVAEFTNPGRGALLRLRVPTGVHAAWLPLVGRPELAYQQELLLEEDLDFTVARVVREAGTVVLECEVSA